MFNSTPGFKIWGLIPTLCGTFVKGQNLRTTTNNDDDVPFKASILGQPV